MTLTPGPRKGTVEVPRSKSHEHRVIIADFLAGDTSRLEESPADNADIRATKRCLLALQGKSATPVLDCGESGSTLRFLMPIAAALGKQPTYRKSGRLAERPVIEYPTLESGEHRLAGNVSSQFVTGLLFALPLVKGDSRIVFTSPLESRGYVDMTLDVLRGAGIVIEPCADGYRISGGQTYRAQPELAIEGDWSGAAFWLVMNALGSEVAVTGLNASSAQPDRAIAALVREMPSEIDVAQFPDIFPVLTILAAAQPRTTSFVGIARLRLKECDRVAAMAETLAQLGVGVRTHESRFEVIGTDRQFEVGEFRTFGDHRIAMSVAVAATRAVGPLTIDNAECAAKSYPGFFSVFEAIAKRQ